MRWPVEYILKRTGFFKKLLMKTDLYEIDMKMQNLIDWVRFGADGARISGRHQRKTKTYEKLCEKLNSLYEKQNKLRRQRKKLEIVRMCNKREN